MMFLEIEVGDFFLPPVAGHAPERSQDPADVATGQITLWQTWEQFKRGVTWLF